MADNRKHVFGTKRGLVVAGVILFVCVGGLVLLSKRIIQPGIVTSASVTPVPIVLGTPQPTNGDSDIYKIGVELSEGQSQPQTVEVLPATSGEPLSPEEIALIFSRLPALTPDPDQQVELNLPQEILPPPRPGNTIEETFPPLETPVASGVETGPTPGTVEAGPLQVLRFAPEGEIPIAPFVSVTFDQPMVPLGTLSDLAEKDVPLKIEPSLPGTWRWLGTKTLTFEYDSELIDRLPKATEYRATVPAGTKSVSGRDTG